MNFEFPFYDSFYTRLYYNNDSWGSLTDNQDEGLLLMDYLDGYTFDNVLDTVNITSDVRFSHVDINDMQAFVIEYTKARFWGDPFDDSIDTYMNWQLWFLKMESSRYILVKCTWTIHQFMNQGKVSLNLPWTARLIQHQ